MILNYKILQDFLSVLTLNFFFIMSHSPNKKSSSSKKSIVNTRAISSSFSAAFRLADVGSIKEKYKIQVPESYHKKRKDAVKQTEVEVVEIDDENNKTSVDVATGILSKYYKDYANYFRICEFG